MFNKIKVKYIVSKVFLILKLMSHSELRLLNSVSLQCLINCCIISQEDRKLWMRLYRNKYEISPIAPAFLNYISPMAPLLSHVAPPRLIVMSHLKLAFNSPKSQIRRNKRPN